MGRPQERRASEASIFSEGSVDSLRDRRPVVIDEDGLFVPGEDGQYTFERFDEDLSEPLDFQYSEIPEDLAQDDVEKQEDVPQAGHVFHCEVPDDDDDDDDDDSVVRFYAFPDASPDAASPSPVPAAPASSTAQAMAGQVVKLQDALSAPVAAPAAPATFTSAEQALQRSRLEEVIRLLRDRTGAASAENVPALVSKLPDGAKAPFRAVQASLQREPDALIELLGLHTVSPQELAKIHNQLQCFGVDVDKTLLDAALARHKTALAGQMDALTSARSSTQQLRCLEAIGHGLDKAKQTVRTVFASAPQQSRQNGLESLDEFCKSHVSKSSDLRSFVQQKQVNEWAHLAGHTWPARGKDSEAAAMAGRLAALTRTRFACDALGVRPQSPDRTDAPKRRDEIGQVFGLALDSSGIARLAKTPPISHEQRLKTIAEKPPEPSDWWTRLHEAPVERQFLRDAAASHLQFVVEDAQQQHSPPLTVGQDGKPRDSGQSAFWQAISQQSTRVSRLASDAAIRGFTDPLTSGPSSQVAFRGMPGSIDPATRHTSTVTAKKNGNSVLLDVNLHYPRVEKFTHSDGTQVDLDPDKSTVTIKYRLEVDLRSGKVSLFGDPPAVTSKLTQASGA